MSGKKKQKTEQKTEQEKTNAYALRISHAVERADDWMNKIEHAGKSRLYTLTPEQKKKVVEELSRHIEAIDNSFAGVSKEKKEKFTL